jgi:CubicO group peptidase (beta-lactamase class C family)
MEEVIKNKKVDDLFISSLNNDIFPGAAYTFSKREQGSYKRESGYYGNAEVYPKKIELKRDSVFDLASLTKVLTTVPLLLILFDKNKLNSQTKLKDIYPSCPSDKSNITVEQLLSHCSGFQAHQKFFNVLIKKPYKQRKKILFDAILREELTTIPGEKHCYSDIGFMLLGFIIEDITGVSLAESARDLLYGPLGLTGDLFYPSLQRKKKFSYVSTEKCPWTNTILSGKVHDDNCRAIGGVAGHAGLFGTLHGVVSMCEQLLDEWKGRGEHPAYSNKQLQRILEPVGNSGWTMGFDLVSESGSSSGNFFSKGSVGHLGFTGTSFWIDPVQDCIVVLLTNRVHPTRENWKIKEFRPVFHDLLMRK